MTTLTTTNVNIGIQITNQANPEWGTFTITGVYDLGIYEIRGRASDRLLYDNEFKFWEISKH